MRKKIICFLFFVLTSNLFATPTQKKEIKNLKEADKKEFLKEKDRDEVVNIITSTQPSPQGILNKIADKLVFDIKGNPLLILPIADSSKDLGLNFGIMPVVAIRNMKKDGDVSSVIAPSINQNEYLGYTYTYRHYLFPTEKSLFVLRASLSDHAQKELFLHYYDPEIFNTKARLNLEFRNWHNPKSSFYGYGPNSRKSDKANYIFYLNGGEASLTFPILNYIYFDYTPSFYENRISNGIVGKDKFSNLYPVEYSLYSKDKQIFTNRFSFLFDNTDHPFIPKIGSYIIFSMAFSRKNIGSDYEYSLYTIEMKDYYNYKLLDKSITAMRFMLQWQTGENIPFYAMPTAGESTGLRMAGDGRFVDRAKILLNVEQRFTVVKAPVMKFLTEFEITPFLDIATVAEKVSKLSTGNFKYGPGMALRIVLRPQIVGTADFAFGSEGLNTIVKINYPF
ncbi:MAG: BamA/TamA family outer membrane protein [Elusimicrobiales bacterium]